MSIDWGPMIDDTGGVPLPPFTEDPSSVNPLDPSFQLLSTTFDGNTGIVGWPHVEGMPEFKPCPDGGPCLLAPPPLPYPAGEDQQQQSCPPMLLPCSTQSAVSSMTSSGKFSLRSKHPLAVRSAGPISSLTSPSNTSVVIGQNIMDTSGPDTSCTNDSGNINQSAPAGVDGPQVPAPLESLNPVPVFAPLAHFTSAGPEYDDDYD